ncbi:MarR family transcriptional regulator [Ectobacillus sp. JY-23]|uniref:MarR family winged helix-turn-helix transcriptional regulator n=1 Tax=Ectobacillus sp. JY-23 TaxID=2933872 RepID=UPI001FF4FBDF|nr:MarR family transcriptional regulator [Ectobacillus sp. JY-23]UOY92427.1 MarR family transcriptional regulator [Ectobacillus sp. JY-23]
MQPVSRGRAVEIWSRMIKVVHKVSQAGGEHLRRWELTPPQFDLIVRIGFKEGITQKELTDQISVTKGNISQLIKKLEEQEYLFRKKEGVYHFLYLTEKGRDIFGHIVPEHDTFIDMQFKGLTTEEQATLNRLLKKLDESL